MRLSPVRPNPGPHQTFLNELVSALMKWAANVVSSDEAVPRVMLMSPNKTVYEVTVADDGTLTTTVNTGKTRV